VISSLQSEIKNPQSTIVNQTERLNGCGIRSMAVVWGVSEVPRRRRVEGAAGSVEEEIDDCRLRIFDF
jgi:hypothetical protein